MIQHATTAMIGSTNPHIRWRDLAAYEFALPPKDEQRRIAEVLWAAESALKAFEDVQKKNDHLKTSIIEEFVTRFRAKHELTPLDNIIEPGHPITYGILKPGLHSFGGVPVIKVKDYPNGVILENDLLLTSPEIDAEYKRSRLQYLRQLSGETVRLAKANTA